MNDKFGIYNPPVAPPARQTPPPAAKGASHPSGPSFDDVFQGQLKGRGELQFSRHAQARMESRGIRLSDADMTRLQTAVDAVQGKGGRDSLVMLDDNALVVSVKNNTVVTVVDQDSLRGNVFTNIDSAVIA